MSARESIAGRALLALLLMIGFYLLVLVIVAALVLLPLLALTKNVLLGIKLGIPFYALAYFFVRSALPRLGNYETPGVELTADQQPEIFSMLREVARKTSQRMPERVYLVPDANAMVYEKGGFFGLFSTRVLCLGYPLFPILNVSELKSIVAHEFGHYSGGDTALGPWIHSSRASAIETAYVLEANSSWLSPIFVGYAKFYLKITQSISRGQEFLADKVAAQTVGSTATSAALDKSTLLYLTWQAFWNGEIVGVLRRSLFPQISAGYRTFYHDPKTIESYGAILKSIREEESEKEFESHPSTQERIRRIMALDIQSHKVNDRSALTLIRDVEQIERQVAVFATEDIAVFNFTPVDWTQTRERVTIPNFVEDLLRWPELVEGLTPARLPAGKTAFDLLVDHARQPRELNLDRQHREAIVLYTLAVALTLRLHEEGWEMHDPIGRSVVLTKGPHSIVPSVAVAQLVNDPTYRQEWRTFCAESGIADLQFSAIRCLAERMPHAARS